MVSKVNSMVCVIFGGGGHARVLLDALQLAGGVHVFAILDQDQKLWGKEVSGIPIQGGDAILPNLKTKGVTHFVVGVGSVKDTSPRARLYRQGLHAGLKPLTVIHPKAICSPHARIGEGTLVCAGAIVNPGAVIGANVIINTGAIIDHDCCIEDHVHVAPGATLSGEVRIGSGAHIGTGASILQGITVGEKAVVGAGAVVISDVPPETLVKGVPAKS